MAARPSVVLIPRCRCHQRLFQCNFVEVTEYGSASLADTGLQWRRTDTRWFASAHISTVTALRLNIISPVKFRLTVSSRAYFKLYNHYLRSSKYDSITAPAST
jgi:hypothetical protein